LGGLANVSTQSYGPGIFNGTSAATPHVAGAAALVLGANPTFTPDQLQSFLIERAVDMGDAGLDTQYGHGRLYLGDASYSITYPLFLKVSRKSASTCHFEARGRREVSLWSSNKKDIGWIKWVFFACQILGKCNTRGISPRFAGRNDMPEQLNLLKRGVQSTLGTPLLDDK
jgi:hypothetical protein